MTEQSIPDQENLLIEAKPAFFDALLNVIDRCCTGNDRIVILELEAAPPTTKTDSVSSIEVNAAEVKAAGATDRYLQVLVDAHGALQVEAMANIQAKENHLSAADEMTMLNLGWRAPGQHSPNWHRVFPDPWPWPSPVVSELVARTLLDIFRAQGEVLRISYLEAADSNVVNRCSADCLRA